MTNSLLYTYTPLHLHLHLHFHSLTFTLKLTLTLTLTLKLKILERYADMSPRQRAALIGKGTEGKFEDVTHSHSHSDSDTQQGNESTNYDDGHNGRYDGTNTNTGTGTGTGLTHFKAIGTTIRKSIPKKDVRPNYYHYGDDGHAYTQDEHEQYVSAIVHADHAKGKQSVLFCSVLFCSILSV